MPHLETYTVSVYILIYQFRISFIIAACRHATRGFLYLVRRKSKCINNLWRCIQSPSQMPKIDFHSIKVKTIGFWSKDVKSLE